MLDKTFLHRNIGMHGVVFQHGMKEMVPKITVQECAEFSKLFYIVGCVKNGLCGGRTLTFSMFIQKSLYFFCEIGDDDFGASRAFEFSLQCWLIVSLRDSGVSIIGLVEFLVFFGTSPQGLLGVNSALCHKL